MSDDEDTSIELWKVYYHDFVSGYFPARKDMRRLRREAALERKLAAAQRKINELNRRIDSLQMTIGRDRLTELVTDRIGYEE